MCKSVNLSYKLAVSFPDTQYGTPGILLKDLPRLSVRYAGDLAKWSGNDTNKLNNNNSNGSRKFCGGMRVTCFPTALMSTEKTPLSKRVGKKLL